MLDIHDPIVQIILALLIINVPISLYIAFRTLGERIIEKSVNVPKYEEVPFPHNKPIDIDAHLDALERHMQEFGVEGTPDTVHEFLKWLYGEDYALAWYRDKNKIYKYEE